MMTPFRIQIHSFVSKIKSLWSLNLVYQQERTRSTLKILLICKLEFSFILEHISSVFFSTGTIKNNDILNQRDRS